MAIFETRRKGLFSGVKTASSDQNQSFFMFSAYFSGFVAGYWQF